MRAAFRFLLVLYLGIQIGLVESSRAAEEIIVTAPNGIEVAVTRYPARQEYLLLWLAPEYGFRRAHRAMAEKLSAQGIEVWQADIIESLFLPMGRSSLRQLNGQYVADLIEHAHKLTGKKIAISGDSYAATNALLGARYWQGRNLADPYLIGAVLFSPYCYASIPPLGKPPEYLPIVDSTNIPLVIYQAQNSGVVGQFDKLLARLRANDSPVYTLIVPDVMSLFYEEEPTPTMLQSARPIPASIEQLLPIMAKHGVPTNPVPLKEAEKTESGIDIDLKDFQGRGKPQAFTLTDINGKPVVRTDFTGKVTVINFWATWCPPCVAEIPSLNRLQESMQDYPFELISINYAEDRKTVADFMARVKVDFPVLLDHNGFTAHQWQVISYPSTFVIDSQGKFRYGVNAAIEWDAPAIMQKLKLLMP